MSRNVLLKQSIIQIKLVMFYLYTLQIHKNNTELEIAKNLRNTVPQPMLVHYYFFCIN